MILCYCIKQLEKRCVKRVANGGGIRKVSILRNTHCMPYGLIVILPPHNNQTELQ